MCDAYETLLKAVEDFGKDEVIPERYLYYTTNWIKIGLEINFFQDVDGIVLCGGIKVWDLNKQKWAVIEDYK